MTPAIHCLDPRQAQDGSHACDRGFRRFGEQMLWGRLLSYPLFFFLEGRLGLIATQTTHCSISRKKVRVLLAMDLYLLSDLLKTHLDNDPAVEIVGEMAEPANLLIATGQTKANVVIQCWPSSGQMPGICTHLMAAYPDLTIIGLSINGDRNYVCRRPVVVDNLPSSDLASVQIAIQEALAEFVSPEV